MTSKRRAATAEALGGWAEGAREGLYPAENDQGTASPGTGRALTRKVGSERRKDCAHENKNNEGCPWTSR